MNFKKNIYPVFFQVHLLGIFAVCRLFDSQRLMMTIKMMHSYTHEFWREIKVVASA